MSKKLLVIIAVAVLMILFAPSAFAEEPCGTIPDGNVFHEPDYYFTGALQLGFDPYGYNYQARQFIGYYGNAYLGEEGYEPYQGNYGQYLATHPDLPSWLANMLDARLVMKWSSDWVDNKDCNGDGFPDQDMLEGSWLTQHASGTYTDANGQVCNWNMFQKTKVTSSGPTPLPPVYNDPCGDVHGMQLHPPGNMGLGY